jgi:hypothetical protein
MAVHGNYKNIARMRHTEKHRIALYIGAAVVFGQYFGFPAEDAPPESA